MPVSDRGSKPLFGIPLSVKENEDVEGYCATLGCTRRLGVISERNSPRVQVTSIMWCKYHHPSLLIYCSWGTRLCNRSRTDYTAVTVKLV